MPRPVPPPADLRVELVEPSSADRAAAKIDAQGRKRLADTLRLPQLSDSHTNVIEHVIATYRRQRLGNADTTIGNTLAAIRELIKAIERAITTRHPREQTKAQKLMDKIRSDRSGLDYQARMRLLSCGETPERVLAEARALETDYRSHPRIESAREPLRQFCGILSLVFDHIEAPNAEDAQDRKLRRRRFALAVLDLADIVTQNFVAHPERLDELLATVTKLPPI